MYSAYNYSVYSKHTQNESFINNTFNYGPNRCYNRLKNTGILINRHKITKYGKNFGWGNSNGDYIFRYYQYVLQKLNSNINIYIPFCDFDPLSSLLGVTSCSKSLGYINKTDYFNYIQYLKKKFNKNIYLGIYMFT